MEPARLRDRGAVTRLLLGAIVAGSPSGLRVVQMVLLPPAVYVSVMVAPGVYHRSRTTTVQVVRRSTSAMLRMTARSVTVWMAAGALWCVIALAGGILMSPLALTAGVPPGVVIAVVMVGVSAPLVWVALSELAHATVLVRTWWAYRGVALTTDWVVGGLAGRPGSGALADAVALVRAVVPPGQTIGLYAATPRHAALYERYGFAPVEPGSLVMAATMPEPAAELTAPS